MDISDLVEATPAPHTVEVPVCFDQSATAALRRARTAATQPDATQSDQDALDQAIEEASRSTVMFALRALSWVEQTDLLDGHPPRKHGGEWDHFDLRAGYNRATYPRAAVAAAVDSPTMTAAEWSAACRAMTAGQFDVLWRVVDRLSSLTTPDIPFVSSSSGSTQTSGAGSRLPAS